MPKRQLREADAHRSHKRQRVTHEAPTSEDIHTARQLQQLLTFDQDLKRARHGLQSLKIFLDGFGSDTGDDRDRRALLAEFLDSAKPRIASEDAVHLSDVMEIWSFGSQVHNDAITSAVPAVLALLLHVISSSLELLPHANGIAQTLLQERQLKLISRNLSSSKGNGYIISPTLRLVREVASLDGGSFARRVFRSRDFTFASFARNLEVRNAGEGVEDPTRPSVRTNAIKFLLTSLKFLPPDARKDLLMQKEVVSHLTFLLKDDPPYLILEMLDTLKRYVLSDDKVPRDVKFRAFGTKTLDRLTGLYTYKHDGDVEGRPPIREAVHEFLTHVCTTPGAGILYTGTGMYPKDLENDAAQEVKDSDDLALERAGWMDKYREDVPVANFALDDFVQKLRPWSSLKHSELLVSIFAAAPELVASYFLANKSFSFEPKLSMTWIGYAAFIFNTVQLPIPKFFGNRGGYRRIPPPTLVLLDNIMPLPLKQKDLSRSLGHKSNMISFFAVRILVLALQKLDKALQMHREASMLGGSSNRPVWDTAARKLIDEFCQRIPDMKDVINCYKTTPEDNVLQREAASRLLLLYYEVIPQMALMANYDVSPSLQVALGRLQAEEEREDPQDQALALMELESLLGIAGFSPGMRWFSKAEGLAASPFVALLRVHATSSQARSLTRLKEVLEFVATQNQLVQGQTGLGLLSRPMRELCRKTKSPEVKIDAIWAFIDNCTNRCANSPLKYLDLMEEMAATETTDLATSDNRRPVSLILVTMVEQLPFVVKSLESESLGVFVKALSSFLGYAKQAGEDAHIIEALARKMNSALPSSKDSSLAIKPKFSKEAFSQENASKKTDETDEMSRPQTMAESPVDSNPAEIDDAVLASTLHVPFGPTEEGQKEDNSALTRWSSKPVDDLIDGPEGHIPALMRLLWSPHASIRREAHTNLLKLAARIRESSHEERDQVWLLISELAESTREHLLAPPAEDPKETGDGAAASPVPGAHVAFALHALDVLRNPLHSLYPRVNSYLTRSPLWGVDKVPLAHDLLHGATVSDSLKGEGDDRYYSELSWLLTYLLDALRSPRDLAVFRRKRWFEKVLALGSNPYFRAGLRDRVLKVLYRATCIGGTEGSTALVTRFGVISWLEAREAECTRGGGDGQEADGPGAAIHGALRRRVWETCDQGRVAAWSKGGAIEHTV